MSSFAKMAASPRALMHAEAQQGWSTPTADLRGYTRGCDERRRERTAVSGLRLALVKEQLKEQAEAYCNYDTQNTKEQIFFQPEITFKIMFTIHHKYKTSHVYHIKGMSERNSQTPSTRQTPFEARLKKALRLSSVPCRQLIQSSPRTGYRKLLGRADSYRRDFRRSVVLWSRRCEVGFFETGL